MPAQELTHSSDAAAVQEAVEKLAAKVCAMRLAAPLLAFLEMHRPLLGLARAGAVVLEPTVWALFGAERSRLLRRALEDPAVLQLLMERIEAGASQRTLPGGQHGGN